MDKISTSAEAKKTALKRVCEIMLSQIKSDIDLFHTHGAAFHYEKLFLIFTLFPTNETLYKLVLKYTNPPVLKNYGDVRNDSDYDIYLPMFKNLKENIEYHQKESK